MKASDCYLNRKVYVPTFNSHGRILGKMSFMVEVLIEATGERLWLHPNSLRESTIALPPNCS